MRSLLLSGHELVVLPGLGHHHEDRLRQGAAAHNEKLEHSVKSLGIGTARLDDRAALLQ